jgi:methylglutaconyl-CoA hydratase
MEVFVKSENVSGVGRITLCRAKKRNALKRAFIEQLSAAVSELVEDKSLRVLVLQAEGSVFCAGMDLGEMQERAQSVDGKKEWQKDSAVFAELLQKLYHAPVPTIAVMQGPALAGGVGLILACDFIVANKDSFVMLPEPARGITAAMVTPFLVHRVGAGRANQLLLSGQRMPIQRCYELGLVHSIAEENELSACVDELLSSIMTGSQAALAITKKHIQNYGTGNLSDYLTASIDVSAQARETDDAREGLAAFLEKRKPKWQE